MCKRRGAGKHGRISAVPGAGRRPAQPPPAKAADFRGFPARSRILRFDLNFRSNLRYPKGFSVPNKAAGVVPLTSLAIDASARFHDSHLTIDARDALRALGLTDGAKLRVCKQGEPCVVQVRATRIGITRRVANAIFVKPDAGRVPVRG
jgi:Fe2+ transport system protein FeoA